jgi:mannose-6-phosphate isomerase
VIERMTGTVAPYAWGSPTFIPQLLGVPPTGEPQAELWLGAHGSASASVGDQPLDELIAADPTGTVGVGAVEAFGPKLSFLFKVLAAAKPLSLQTHPSRAQAEAGFAREEQQGLARDAAKRLYRDDWPKPEALCALMDTEALCGFRDPQQTYALFDQLGVPAALELVADLGDPAIDGATSLEQVLGRLLRLQEEECRVVDEVVQAATHALAGAEGEFRRFAVTARDLGGYYPGDPGVLAGLLLNRISLKPLEAVYLPAGNLHSYLYGGGIEIMANSDNVLRGGLTPKHVDVDELLTLLDFTPGTADVLTAVEDCPGVWRYPTRAPEFALWRVEPSGSTVELPATNSGRVLLATAGSLALSTVTGQLTLDRGQSAFATATEVVRVSGQGTLFVGGPGLAVATTR